jgi:hypothetical protein
MQNNQFVLDTVNIKKALPLAAGLAVALAVVIAFVDIFDGILGILLFATWVYIGVYFANMILASGEKASILNVGINGAILAAIAGLLYRIVVWVMLSIRFSESTSSFPISLYFLEAGILGGLAAFAWYAYKTSVKTG